MFYNKQTVWKKSGKGFSLKEWFKVANKKWGTIAKQARKKTWRPNREIGDKWSEFSPSQKEKSVKSISSSVIYCS